ncbi:MAG: dienelactone hydrolase family protein [Candidatus Velthaea sp.]
MSDRSDPIVAWRLPAKRGPATPLLVFLHGRGADEHDLLDCANALPPEFAYASVRAPIELDGGGYTWFESRAVARPVAATLRASIDRTRVWLDGPATAPFNRKRTYLFGFSAGMMMAGAMLLDDPARFAGAVLCSGAIPFDAGIAAPPQRLAGIPIFNGHGSLDDVIPASLVAQTGQYLRDRSGALLTAREYPHGHAISPRELDEVGAWLRALP